MRYEREFLIRLAAVWLACRWRVMGNGLAGKSWPKPMLEYDLLGMIDYAHEMRLLCAEVKPALPASPDATVTAAGRRETRWKGPKIYAVERG